MEGGKKRKKENERKKVIYKEKSKRYRLQRVKRELGVGEEDKETDRERVSSLEVLCRRKLKEREILDWDQSIG